MSSRRTERCRGALGARKRSRAMGTQAGRVEVAGARAGALRPRARPPGKEEDDRGGARWAGLANWAGQVGFGG